MQAVVRLHLISAFFYRCNAILLSRALEFLIRFLYAAYIPAAARIHPSARFEHSALGVVVNRAARIGAGCQIGPHVVLGGRSHIFGAPSLGDNVIVHSGAKLIGPIVVGEGTVVGANAVVTSDLPPKCLAVGVPAVVKKYEISTANYRQKEN